MLIVIQVFSIFENVNIVDEVYVLEVIVKYMLLLLLLG